MKKCLLISVLVFSSAMGFSQKQWTLQECIDFALKNNLSVRQSELSVQSAEESLTQAKGDFLPSLNGFASNTWRFGRTIDPFTNEFATNGVQSWNMGLSAQMNLFSGMQNLNAKKQRELEVYASKLDADRAVNEMVLAVSQAYLQVLFALERERVAEGQAKITASQVKRTSVLVKAGSLPKSNLLDLEAQLASEELSIINTGNDVQMAFLQLKQLMRFSQSETFDVARPDLSVESVTIPATAGQIYNSALTEMPQVKAAEVRVEGSETAVKIAKGNYSPSLSLNASLGTGFTENNKIVTGQTISGQQQIGFTESGAPVYAPTLDFTREVKPYGDQLADNLNQSIGVSLSIPIFNRFSTSTQVNRSRIQQEMQETSLLETKYGLEQEVQRAYLDAVAAKKMYEASEKSAEASAEAFRYANSRYELGAMNSVDYNAAKNRLAQSQSDVIRAKYDYIYKVKILDFYRGNPITLE